jgi:hypothetical protein
MWVRGMWGPETQRADRDITRGICRGAKMVWKVRVLPERVLRSAFDVLQNFLLAAMLFVMRPVIFLARTS